MTTRALDRLKRPFTQSRAFPALATGAHALGVVTLGAIALGAVAIGAFAIGRLVIGRARIKQLEIDELVVHRLRVTEQLSVPPKPHADHLVPRTYQHSEES